MIGENNPMYGITPIFSDEIRQKMRLKAQGANNIFWKDGRTPLRKLIRGTYKYRIWRDEVFKRDNYTCQDCGQHGGRLHAHHKDKQFNQILDEFLKKYNMFSPYEDIETLVALAIIYEDFWDVKNGQTLCVKCHVLKPKHTNLIKEE